MKFINFLKTISPEQQRSLHRWYTITVYAFALLALCIMIAQIHQCYSAYTVYTAHNNMHKNHSQTSLRKYTDLQATARALQQSINKTEEQLHQQTLYTDHLHALKSIATHNMQSCVFGKNHVDCIYRVAQMNEIKSIMQQFCNAAVYADAQIIQIEPDAQGMIIHIRATLQ